MQEECMCLCPPSYSLYWHAEYTCCGKYSFQRLTKGEAQIDKKVESGDHRCPSHSRLGLASYPAKRTINTAIQRILYRSVLLTWSVPIVPAYIRHASANLIEQRHDPRRTIYQGECTITSLILKWCLSLYQTPYELMRRSHRFAQRQVEKDFVTIQVCPLINRLSNSEFSMWKLILSRHHYKRYLNLLGQRVILKILGLWLCLSWT